MNQLYQILLVLARQKHVYCQKSIFYIYVNIKHKSPIVTIRALITKKNYTFLVKESIILYFLKHI